MNVVLVGFVSLLVVDILLRVVLNWSCLKWLKKPVPKELAGVYSDAIYRRSQLYQRSRLMVSLLSQLAIFVLVLVLILGDYVHKIDVHLQQYFTNEFVLGVSFFVVIGSLFQLVRNIFEGYQQLIIDKRFGFEKSFWKVFRDFLFRALLTFVLGSVAFWFLMFSFNWLEADFWAASWLLFGFVYLLYNYVNQHLVSIISSRNYVSLPSDISQSLAQSLKKYDIKVTQVLIRKNSLTQDIPPASIIGWGSRARIVLSEKVIKLLNIREITAIILHEESHNKHNHLIELVFGNIIQLGLLLLVLWLSLSQPYLQQVFGAVDFSLHLGLFVFVILFSPVTLVVNALINSLSRYFERQADDDVNKVGLADALISALKKLAAKELINRTPHPAYVAFYSAHPTLSDRIKSLKKK